MSSFINTNTASLNAQRNLNSSQGTLATSLQRLSSGLRINSAKDDAAGLAISERFTSQIRGLDQAVRNSNDAISLSQTAEGALGTVGDNLQRVRELAVQSSNATNAGTDRSAIQKEVSQLKGEINRVATQTSFNGTKVLDGTFAGASFQVGANAGETITIGKVTDARTASLGSSKFSDSAAQTIAATDTLVGFKINGTAIDDVAAGTGTAAEQTTAIAAAVNAKYDQTGVYASVNGTAITYSAAQADTDIKFTAGTSVATPPADVVASAATAKTVADIDTSSFVGSQRAVVIADRGLKQISDGRADLGAVQNRFSSAISNLQSTSENLSSARSRIQDTDFASETAKLTRGQILQQAGTAMLAQANSLPNGVLALLRG